MNASNLDSRLDPLNPDALPRQNIAHVSPSPAGAGDTPRPSDGRGWREATGEGPDEENAPEFFPRRPAETPRAYGAFLAYFQLGHARSLQAVADKLGENPGTVKNWSSKFDWAERIQNYHSGLLQAQARDHAALHLKRAADWNRRLEQFREQEWEVAQQLLSAARCFLETFGEDDLRQMSLSQVSRALQIASGIARSALAGADLPVAADSDLSPLQQQLLAGVARVFGPPPSPPGPASGDHGAQSNDGNLLERL